MTVNVTEAEFAAAATAAADAAKIATRYKFSCGSSQSSTTAQDTATYRSFKEVWPTPNYTGSDTCLIKIDGYSKSEKPRLNPAEQAVVDTVAANGGDVTVPSAAYFTVLELCTKLPDGYVETFEQKADLKKSTAKAALAMCPDAPHAAGLQEVITAVKISDGTYVVGETMQPGTYKTKPGVKDCYWTRNAGGGDIIDNDFVSFAPKGVTVAVRSGEGFISERCGIWTKIG
ncbi:hypothetical protein [Arthrobacter sp. AL12]|uniref:hypothetical protein n=1 Tax=Arthrobacter sp. AL12 TaxID=3042241 RepID=UPI00249C02AA|nr:hypothetical protein [Arthrobacter sp. AL12]MDI3213211.1 hypothetical protein [Arthrobacter sp. AL12]